MPLNNDSSISQDSKPRRLQCDASSSIFRGVCESANNFDTANAVRYTHSIWITVLLFEFVISIHMLCFAWTPFTLGRPVWRAAHPFMAHTWEHKIGRHMCLRHRRIMLTYFRLPYENGTAQYRSAFIYLSSEHKHENETTRSWFYCAQSHRKVDRKNPHQLL